MKTPTATQSASAAAILACLLAAAMPACARSTDDFNDAIATDRPDFVESSKVVGRGRIQIETSGAFARSGHDGLVERTVSTPTLLRLGASDTLEVRIETDGATHSWTRGIEQHDASGMADTGLGLKWHVRDGAGGVPALGMLLHVDLPGGARRLRGGDGPGVRPSLRGVAEWDLPGELSLGVMPGVPSERSDDGKRFTSGIFGIVLGKDWSPRLHSYIEMAAPRIARAGDGGTQASAGFGSAYLLTPNCQIDAGILGGLNRRTASVSITAGLSIRL